MKTLKIQEQPATLVDQVEDRLLTFLKENNLKVGDPIPNETELSAALGVARSVLREALSRLKMIGMIQSRTRRGMVLTEPSLFGSIKRIVDPRILSKESLYELLEIRISLEIGMSYKLFQNLTPEFLRELEEIVKIETVLENNEYSPVSEISFHSKLYEITGNASILNFQEIIHPIMVFIKDQFRADLAPINQQLKAEKKLVTHADLFQLLADGDEKGYRKAIEQHFSVYTIFLKKQQI
jgi:GntR family transcriptional repressor for pyruvate dehydrogenase complex